VQAASDLKALAHLIPATARLQLDPGVAPVAPKAAAGGGAAAPAVEYLQVATKSVRKGDIVRVLPGALGFGVGGVGGWVWVEGVGRGMVDAAFDAGFSGMVVLLLVLVVRSYICLLLLRPICCFATPRRAPARGW